MFYAAVISYLVILQFVVERDGTLHGVKQILRWQDMPAPTKTYETGLVPQITDKALLVPTKIDKWVAY